MNKTAAFTLLEVMLVLSLLGLLIIINPFSQQTLGEIKLDATAERIVNDLKWARLEAIMQKKTYHFRIYRADNLYRQDDDGQAEYIIYYQDENGRMIVVKEGFFSADYTLYKNLLPEKVTADYYDRISFSALGTARNGSIGLKDNQGRMVKIVVSPLGRVRVEKED